VDQSYQGRQFHWLASPHGEECQQVLSRIQRDTTRPHESSTQERALHEETAARSLQFSVLPARQDRNDVFMKSYHVRETIFSDQTDKYPTTSQCSNKYIIVLVEIDSNAVIVEPPKSQNDSKMIRAYNTIVQRLITAGMQLRKHVLDNEISENTTKHIKEKYQFNIELVPPGCHHRNAAEVAICNFKAHFLSVLAGTADNFPTNLWDHLLPQTEITLNLLCQSNAMPTASAYAHLSGHFNYKKMPLVPMGCEVQVHEKTDKRGTWAYHCHDGWYLYTSPEHYCVHNCQIKQTKKERPTNTIHFKHKSITNPIITSADKLMHTIANLQASISDKIKNNPSQQLKDLHQIAANVSNFRLPS
jgi:hypothetical protein